MRGIVPDQAIMQIQRHLRAKCKTAQQGFFQMEMDEDSVTGALGERLRTTRSQGRKVLVNGKLWRWRVSFQKLRGEGPKAAERSVGAAGLFQIEVEDHASGQMWRKGMLFQGKMSKDSDRARLKRQMEAMESITPMQSLVVEYDRTGYRSIPSHQLLTLNKSLRTVDSSQLVPLGDLLADRFVECTMGVKGMYYDAQRRAIFNANVHQASDAPWERRRYL